MECQRDGDRLIDRAIHEVDRLHGALARPATSAADRDAGIDASRLAGIRTELAALARAAMILEARGEGIGDPSSCSIRDTGPEVEALFELPGVPRGSLRVRYAAGRLVVEGNRPDPSETGRPAFSPRPRSGPFRQTLPIPVPIDAAGGSAIFREGRLIIRLPKRGGATYRRATS